MLGKEEIVSPSLDELKEHYHRILTLLGEDAGREGLQKTPELFQSPSLAVPCRRFPQYRRSGCHDASVAGYWCIQGSFYRERADKHPLIKNYHVRKRRNCISFIR